MRRIDRRLGTVLRTFSLSYAEKRRQALNGLDFEGLRSRLAEVRDQTLDNLQTYLAQFEDQARRHGSEVARARDSREANRLILEILERHGAKKLFKGKSMVSEETRLNGFLREHGVEPRETDLGEWILQLENQAPSHMVMPAIHLTREDVAAIFSKKVKRTVPAEIPALVRVAREELRREIFGSQVGLIGANALIAENGAAMLVTNEGNGRLVSTIPPVLIILASLEKIFPKTTDALLLLRLLPRNATGQTITSYVSFISGPHRGPQYIILVDNRRSELAADPVFRETLRCIKCSACLNVCPVYQILGGKEFSHIYMGGIGSLLTAWIHGLKESKKLAGLCLGCHRCEEVCATKIRIADLIIALKERLNNELGKRLWKRIAFDGIMSRPAFQQTGFALGRRFRPMLEGKKGLMRKLPPGLGRLDAARRFPAPARKSLSRLFKAETVRTETQGKGLRIVLFPGCLVENFYPEIGISATRVLRRLGYGVRLIRPLCCGFPPANSGFPKSSRRAYRELLKELGDEDFVVTLCPTCTTMLGHLGPRLLPTDAAERVSRKTLPFSRFVHEMEGKRLSEVFPVPPAPETVTYHDSCHHKFLLKASAASRKVIRDAWGKDILEMEGADSCCGFAGSFSIEQPGISSALLEEKLASIQSSGADLVALDCPGCLLQIRGGCRQKGLPVRVKHTAEVLAERLIK